MKLLDFLKTWEGTEQENKWNRLFMAGLIAMLCLMTLKLFSKETIVTIQPMTLSEEAWVSKHQASASYKQAWGFFLAQLTGNITPSTVNFIKARIGPLLSPAIYQQVIDTIEVQAKQIQNDRVTMRFEPRLVEYETDSDKVFVYGYSFEKGASSQEQRSERTYEYVIKVAHYLPLIERIDTYIGQPRTQKVLAQRQREEERAAQEKEKQ